MYLKGLSKPGCCLGAWGYLEGGVTERLKFYNLKAVSAMMAVYKGLYYNYSVHTVAVERKERPGQADRGLTRAEPHLP